ncbi:MAG: tetratricopeptide repeat protein [Gemmatimonadota bacterium]
MKSYQELFAELKRRKVFKVVGVYGIASFGVLQAADIMLPRLGLPDWTVTFMVALVVLAFPVVLIMAWAFEVTSEGVKRTDAPAPGEIEEIMAAPASQRWPAGLLALVGVAALVASTWWIARRTAPETGGSAESAATPADVRLAASDDTADTRPSLAVLPFVNMSADEDQDYFSDGITEEILNTLARVREIKVVARTSAFAFRGRNLDMRAIGNSLGVEYLIEGSVRKAGNQLRITAQLIDAADGTHLWSDQYTRPMDDVFAIQTEIAQAIAQALKVPLGLDDASDLVTPTADLEAYDLYLAARGRMRERGESLPEAIRLFEAAIARDSTWAPAWAGLAEAREVIGWYPEVWEEGLPATMEERAARFEAFQEPAAAAARRALALDPDNPSAHVALGSVHRNRMQWGRSEAEYLRASELDPENAEAHFQYAQFLMDVGRLNEAIREIELSIELDPGVPVTGKMLAAARLMVGQYEEALAELDRAEPGRTGTGNLERWVDASANIALGRYDALRSMPGMQADTRSPESVDLAIQMIQSGDIDLLSDDFIEPVILMQFGRDDAAAELLLSQFRVNPILNIGIHWMPLFDPIRDHPAYLTMLREANLEGVTPDRPAP